MGKKLINGQEESWSDGHVQHQKLKPIIHKMTDDNKRRQTFENDLTSLHSI